MNDINDLNTLAALVLSGAGESLYEISVPQITPTESESDTDLPALSIAA